jgi:hypothetical protein
LVISQQSSIKRYNKIVCKQFDIDRIVERMEAVDKMTRYCGYPSPGWLCAMIIKLYKQMTGIGVHAEKNCKTNPKARKRLYFNHSNVVRPHPRILTAD